MSTFSQFIGGGGGATGPRNTTKMWASADPSRFDDSSGQHSGAYTWIVPANFDVSVPLRVYVWGAGGCGGMSGGSGTGYGGGGGGLAISEISNLSPGDSVTVSVYPLNAPGKLVAMSFIAA